jgi:serine/threonine-protein kinase
MSIPFGRYELLQKLASGGMGQVFLARKKGVGFEKLVVMKRILPHLQEDEDFLAMLLDEARLTARLNHPNIAQVFDVEVEAGEHVVVMEYIEGEDVRRIEKRVSDQGISFPLGIAIRIVADAAAGLDYAHRARDDHGGPLNMVHRDVSPQNVLVGFDGAVKVIDFGVAKALGRSQNTDAGIVKGKFAYMSPEQAWGHPVDARSDIFSLGIMLWELLCDQRLFRGQSDEETRQRVTACEIPPPSLFNPLVSKELETVILKALAPRKENRFESAQDFREALEQCVHRANIPASTAHVSAFMRQLYAERIVELADPQKLDRLTPEDGFVLKRLTGEEPARLQSALQPAVPSAEPKKPLKRMRWLVFALVALLSLATGAALVRALRSASSNRSDSLRADSFSNTDNVSDNEISTGAVLKFQVSTEPSGAEVALDEVRQGVTPLLLSVEKANTPSVLTLTLDGFETQSMTLTQASPHRVAVSFQKKKKSLKPLEIKTGR